MNTKSIKTLNSKQLLLQFKEKFDIELGRYLKRKIDQYYKISDFSGKFTENFADACLRGGKRLRPAFVYYSYKLFGGNDEKEIIKLSMFIELIQTFLLIHDDIIDRALLRRGGSTIHKIYEDFSRQNKFDDDSHFGYAMGIISGDLGNQFALEIISESKFPTLNKNLLLNLVSREISKVCFGEIHDILLGYNYPKIYKAEDVFKVHFYKTATYTYRLPLFAGAVMSGVKKTELESLDGYAVNGGIAFQIRDDVLGVFGEDEKTGKDVKGDLIEGKKTLLATQAYHKANKEQKVKLDKYIGKKDLSDSEADEIRKIFVDTGSLEYSKSECEKYVAKAKESLSKLSSKDPVAYEFLEDIADYMIMRNL